ncbi:MAG: hypothetical protein ABSH56_18615 [Bryobacteraceae bacterium]
MPEDPKAPEDPRAAVVSHLHGLDEIYPATGALLLMGKSAVSALVDLVANPSSSDVAQYNAAEVLFWIHSLHISEAVALLNNAARSSTDYAAAHGCERLRVMSPGSPRRR